MWRSSRTRLGAATIVLSAVLVGCQATNLGPAASAARPGASAPTTAPASVSGSPTVEPASCIGPRAAGSGTPAGGTLLGKIDQGRILFGLEGAAGTPGGTFAYAVIDTSGLHVVATNDWTMGHETWAPDGQIMFDSGREGDRHLFRSAVDGSNAIEVTNDAGRLPGGAQASYSESSAAFIGSNLIVFAQWDCAAQRDLGLHTVNADGSGMREFTPGHGVGSPISDDQPAVSPDGKTVVFVRFSANDDSAGGLFALPVADSGGAATRLTPDASGMQYPRFSPDGKLVLFSEADASGESALWVVPAAGGTPRELTKLTAGMGAIEADWSPDGSEIVTKEYLSGWTYNELHIIRADGTHDRLLWRGQRSTAETPHWAP